MQLELLPILPFVSSHVPDKMGWSQPYLGVNLNRSRGAFKNLSALEYGAGFAFVLLLFAAGFFFFFLLLAFGFVRFCKS